MSRFPPLTPQEAIGLWQRNRSREVHRLLWEVHRLQQIAVLMDQFMAEVQQLQPCMPSELRYQLMALLEKEHVVRKARAQRARAARRLRPSLFLDGQVDATPRPAADKHPQIIQAP